MEREEREGGRREEEGGRGRKRRGEGGERDKLHDCDYPL